MNRKKINREPKRVTIIFLAIRTTETDHRNESDHSAFRHERIFKVPSDLQFFGKSDGSSGPSFHVLNSDTDVVDWNWGELQLVTINFYIVDGVRASVRCEGFCDGAGVGVQIRMGIRIGIWIWIGIGIGIGLGSGFELRIWIRIGIGVWGRIWWGIDGHLGGHRWWIGRSREARQLIGRLGTYRLTTQLVFQSHLIRHLERLA